jgi:hypothetical protein
VTNATTTCRRAIVDDGILLAMDTTATSVKTVSSHVCIAANARGFQILNDAGPVVQEHFLY